jgi:hypothetical protein
MNSLPATHQIQFRAVEAQYADRPNLSLIQFD